MSGSTAALLGANAGGLVNFASNLKLGVWAWNLQPASWRGIPFVVKSSTIKRGRRVAIHEYPYSDTVWVEDLGLGTRVVDFSGFLIGDDVFAQRDQMVAAAEISGTGVLVHPSLGSLTVSLTNFAAGERFDLGRVVEIEFSFIQSQTSPLFPTTALSTVLTAISTAAQTVVATATDFTTAVTTAIGGINAGLTFASNVFESVVGVITGFTSLAVTSAGDGAAAHSAVLGLPGNNGRYTFGAIPEPPNATVASVLAGVSAARAAVATAAASTAAVVDPTLLPASVQALTESVRTVFINPADQIRIMTELASYSPTISSSTAPIGAAVQAIQIATVQLIQAAALISLANATTIFQPTSYNEAIAVLEVVDSLFDVTILAVADAGFTASYLALQAQRAAMVTDLLARAANLPQLVTVTRAVPLPSLTLAYSLYADATRSDELISRANPISPLFMPTSFKALSS